MPSSRPHRLSDLDAFVLITLPDPLAPALGEERLVELCAIDDTTADEVRASLRALDGLGCVIRSPEARLSSVPGASPFLWRRSTTGAAVVAAILAR